MYKIMSKILTHGKYNSDYIMYNSVRHYVVKMEKKDKGKVSNLKQYWFSRYINYIKNYEKTLEQNFPTTVRFCRVFKNGIKDFFVDLKSYMNLLKKQNFDGLYNLKREEIQLMYTMPKDIAKISPVLLISVAPFTNYVVLPLAYYFPRQLLTHHFWTSEQKANFMLLYHEKQFKHSRPLFHCMEAKVNCIDDELLKRKWSGVISCLASGAHPTVQSIISCAPLFKTSPYSLETLDDRHMKELLRIHGLTIWRPFRRQRLLERGILLKRMDDAIVKEGGVAKIPVDALYWVLSFRGLNPVNMSVQCMKDWLEEWLVLSKSVNNSTLSLLLHSPILLAYNHVNNLRVLYK